MAYSTLSEDLFEGKAMKTVDKMRDVLDDCSHFRYREGEAQL